MNILFPVTLLLLTLATGFPEEPAVPEQAPQKTDPGIGGPDSDVAVHARQKAMEVAGAFSNDGFKLRDGYWTSSLNPKETQVIEVNLFRGNEYWFTIATASLGSQWNITAFDETGKKVEGQEYKDDGVAAIGIEPPASGRYFLRVELLEGNAAQFCLLYSYK